MESVGGSAISTSLSPEDDVLAVVAAEPPKNDILVCLRT